MKIKSIAAALLVLTAAPWSTEAKDMWHLLTGECSKEVSVFIGKPAGPQVHARQYPTR
jgi:hypothetical protein